MVTHQSLSGSTDEAFTQRMASSYPERFDEAFWSYFTAEIGAGFPPHPVVVDLGCGPGLLLRDIARRYPQATLYGYDVTPAMIAYAQSLDWPGTKPTLAIHDAQTEPLRLAPGSVHLLCMMSVLHIIDDPLAVLAESRRVLAPDGIFLLRDWVRAPLKDYLARRQVNMDEDLIVSRQRGFRLFPMHNKYTLEDWEWLLAEAGFHIRSHMPLPPTHHLFVMNRRDHTT